jgi:hypothetical protein
MPRPFHVPWFYYSNNVWWRVQVTKFLITQFSPASYYFLSLFHSLHLRQKCKIILSVILSSLTGRNLLVIMILVYISRAYIIIIIIIINVYRLIHFFSPHHGWRFCSNWMVTVWTIQVALFRHLFALFVSLLQGQLYFTLTSGAGIAQSV